MEYIIAVTAIVVVIAAGAALLKKWNLLIAKKVIADMAKIYNAMSRVIHQTEADRFLIIGLHNGGKKINVHSKLYITIFFEENSAAVPSVKLDYNTVRVDGSYIKTVKKVLDENSISGWVKDMQPSMLKDIYDKDGIKRYHLFYIGVRQNTHYFGSVTSTSETSLESPGQFVEINVAKNKIRKIFSLNWFLRLFN